jgi:hypothetical protein
LTNAVVKARALASDDEALVAIEIDQGENGRSSPPKSECRHGSCFVASSAATARLLLELAGSPEQEPLEGLSRQTTPPQVPEWGARRWSEKMLPASRRERIAAFWLRVAMAQALARDSLGQPVLLWNEP